MSQAELSRFAPQNGRPRPERLGNRLLELLPQADFERLMERAERVPLRLHEPICEPGEPIRSADFPLTSVLSSVVPLEDGSVIEAATVGNEGMMGIDLLANRRAAVYRVFGQVEGESIRISAKDFRALLAESDPLRRVLEKYALTVIHQSGQTAACNLRHDVRQRMCRWLLMTHDRVRRDKFFLTQEFLGQMLGVRRQTVSVVAAPLQDEGLFHYSRGNITILDRARLERASCECYRAVTERYRMVMDSDD